MRKPVIAVATVVVLAALGGGGFALFERHERSGLVAKSERACGDLAAPATAQTLPLDLPLLPGARVLRTDSQGSTTIAFTSVPGDRDRLVGLRDDVLASLTAKGYEVVGHDQEPGYEAEAEVRGPHEGTVKVTPLCEGLLQVRYALSPA